MGRKSPRHGAAVRGRTQKFLTPAAKSFVAGISPPGRLKRDVVISAPGKSGGGEPGAGRRSDGRRGKPAPSGAAPYPPAVSPPGGHERRIRRDGAAHPFTDAASRVLRIRP
ncbi:hypothetical protein YY63_19085 [Salmonella enterica subsp. enterica]|nr:hypothetical protein [Salmonella enterica subsp. enterica serovar Oranienburg]MIP06415.1 hypothetical protein [Salmonella enterica subsp. enterica serovar Oranienburg]